MNALEIPVSLNYIGVFLTFECNLNCSYCINDPEQAGARRVVFRKPRGELKTELTPDEWIAALKRLPKRKDLPVTFQGGEPLLYGKGAGLGKILDGIEAYADLLTNFPFPDPKIGPERFQRKAPYPSVRASLHVHEMNRLWGDGLQELVFRCEKLREKGFRVGPTESDVGIYIVDHPENEIPEAEIAAARKRLPVYFKDFLGFYRGRLHGRYAYPYSTDLLASKAHHMTLECECRTTELLIDPLGFVWDCHLALYDAWKGPKPSLLFREMENFDFARLKARYDQKNTMFPRGHILDPAFRITEDFHNCFSYGRCLACDTKVKRDRFASENVFRSSVIIRNIRWPKELKQKVSNDYK